MSTSIPIPSNKPQSSTNIAQTPGGTIFSAVAQTPGGTIYGTTPGGMYYFYKIILIYYPIGTKKILDKQKLLSLRNSPMAKTPPANLPKIYGMTPNFKPATTNTTTTTPAKKDHSDEDGGGMTHKFLNCLDDIFEMDK